ncbi:elongation factor G, partial [Salmonella enterica subsp. enterica serovar Infantis]
AVIEARGK